MSRRQPGAHALGAIEHLQSPFPRLRRIAAAPAARPRRVLVLGAGMAGLAAAYELAAIGHEVTVLEARDRAGGRVWTHGGFQQGQHVEYGAMYVPAHHNLVVGYAQHFGLALDVVPNADALVYYLRGRLIPNPQAPDAPWPGALTPEERQGGVAGLLMKYLVPAAKSLGDPRAPGWPSPELLRLDDVSVVDYLRQQGASPAVVGLLSVGYVSEWGDGPRALSALFLLRDLAFYIDAVPPHRFAVPGIDDGDDGVDPNAVYTVRGGTARLADAFVASKELAGRVRLRAPIEAIRWDERSVSVRCRDGSALTGDAAICTIPFSVLRDVELDGPLSPGKRDAIAGLRLTSVTRVYVQASERVWTKDGTGMAATDLPIMLVNDQTATQPGPAGILEACVTGEQGRAFAALSRQQRVAEATAQLDEIFPGFAARALGGDSKCWVHDEWARGDYCWCAPGEMRRFLPYVGTREGCLHFAGEHTSALPGWMEGALESGHRAAGEVHAAAAGASPERAAVAASA